MPAANIWNRDFDYYKTKLPYPDRPSKPALMTAKVESLSDADLASIPAVRAQYEQAIATYNADREAYRKDEGRLVNEFQADLAEAHNLTGHPKEPTLYNIAWDMGHSYGLSEVASHYETLSELLDPVKK